jgi:hypothetical protein
MSSLAFTLSAISNEKALLLFKAIIQSETNNDDDDDDDDGSNSGSIISITKLGLTRKQFYSIMKKLIDAGLVKRSDRNGLKYHPTPLGRIVLDVQAKLEIVFENYWKLKALDSVIISAYNTHHHLSAEEYQILVDILIENEEIKAMLFSNKKSRSE